MVGYVVFDDRAAAWRVGLGTAGAPFLIGVRKDQVMCSGLPLPPPAAAAAAADEPQSAPQFHPADFPLPAEVNGIIPLQSLPGAQGVIYLDFDGEAGPFEGWPQVTRDAAPAGANTLQIKEVWQRVAEDYQTFNLNVTTDRRVYDIATETSRIHVLLTPTRDAAPTAGGIALLRSFNWAGDTVCWAYGLTGKNAAEIVSHEVGHTLGLSHDGRLNPVEEYYAGQGSGEVGWAPIMGVGYYKNLTQWSRGEYAGANNREDDLEVITNQNNAVDFRTDDTANTWLTAAYLDILPDSTVSHEGIIETRADADAWRFQSDGGDAILTVNPVSSGADLDIQADILTSSGSLVASSNPESALAATVAAALPAGDYLLRISGVGRGDPMTTGYPDYGSLGAYLISGSVSHGVKHDRFNIAENSPEGTIVGSILPRKNHGSNPITYRLSSGNSGGAFSIHPSSGVLSVVRAAALDYEALSMQWDDPASFGLFISITDPAAPELNELIRAVVNVTPVNEAPTLAGGSALVFTRTGPGVPVFRLSGGDPDRFDFPRFSIASGNASGAFAMDPSTGQLSTTANFPGIHPGAPAVLTVRATDQASPSLAAEAVVTVSFLDAPSGYSPGGLMRTYFENINGAALSSFTSHPRYINYSPDAEELLTAFDAADHGKNYGSLARAWLLPPVSGNYTFWIAADDTAELRISADRNPSGPVRATVSPATRRYQYNLNASQQSIPLALVAGQPYYMEVRHKQAIGNDHLAVAWQGPGFSRQVISGAYLVPYVQQVAPVIESRRFSARRGSVSGTVLGTLVATDVNPGDLPASWAITGGAAAAWCGIDASTGLLFVHDPAALNASTGNSSSLNVRVMDGSQATLSGASVIPLNIIPPDGGGPGGMVQQIWTGLTGPLGSLPADARFPDAPSFSRLLAGFESPAGPLENYGSRIRAMLVPPVSGTYHFYLAGDAEASLKFAATAVASKAIEIARVPSATARNAWNIYPQQRSPDLVLTAGQACYMEVLHKGNTSGGFVQAAWTGPGIPAPSVIPASALLPYDTRPPLRWNTASYHFPVTQGDRPGTLAGIVSAVDPDQGGLAYSITAGNTGGAFAINPFTGAISIANPDALMAGQTYALSLRVQDSGAEGLPFKSAVGSASIVVQSGLQRLRPAGRTASLPAGQGMALAVGASGRAGASFAWSKVDGPGIVTFDDGTACTTGAVFSAPGWYVIRGTETAGGAPLALDFAVQAGAVVALPGGDAIGVPGTAGSHVWNAGNCRIMAGGSGFQGGRLDSGYYLHQPAGTDLTITARVTLVQDISGPRSMAGLMIRESLAAEARSIFCGLTSQNARLVIQRSTAGLVPVTNAMQNPASAPDGPVWLRIIRQGNTFTSYTAGDLSGEPGVFMPLGSPQTFPMGASCLVGLAAASGTAGSPGTFDIDHLVITPSWANLAPAVSVQDPAAAFPNLTLALHGGVTDDKLPAPPNVVVAWSKWSGPGGVTFGSPASEDSTATFSAPGPCRLRLTADDGEVRSFRELPLTVEESPIEFWRAANFGVGASLPLTAGDPADPDKDGLLNLLEYAFALNPLKADAPLLAAEAAWVSGNWYLRLTVTRNPLAADVSGVIESSTTPEQPGSWSAAGTVVEINTPGTLSARTTQPQGNLGRQFLRFRVSR